MLFCDEDSERISAHIAIVAARSTLLRNRIRQAKEQVNIAFDKLISFFSALIFFFLEEETSGSNERITHIDFWPYQAKMKSAETTMQQINIE